MLPAQVHQVLNCGSWKEGATSGHYRVVLFDVSYGTGTEVYVQRIQEDAQPSGLALRLVETLPIRELNDDHAQYQVVSARCGGLGTHSVVDLVATFEHDERDIKHHVRITLPAPGSYRITGVVGQRSPNHTF